ncbi:MAG: phosphatase family protein [Gammaproteobacteria bacterium]|jgi:membrane-associated phospholipid phosphatase|nr:phosphatase family protein [Gammaproteobacteria bacterium]
MLTKEWLLKRVVICTILASVLGIISYSFWDRAIVLWLSQHHSRQWDWAIHVRGAANILTKFPEYASAPLLIYFFIRIVFGCLSTVEKKCLIGFIALLIAFFGICSNYIRSFLGRAWPATWTHDNLSFLGNGVYGFHLGINNPLFCSFPSCHSLTAALLATFCWYYFPRLRWVVLAYALFVMFIMVIQYYHFLSDVIIGAGIGYLTMITVYFCTKQHLLELE